MEFEEILETILNDIVSYAILLFEYIGVVVIIIAGVRGAIDYASRRSDTRLRLAQGLAMGLEFKLGSEILRTVVLRTMSELAVVAGIIALRAVLTVLIHWEIQNEKEDEKEEREEEREEEERLAQEKKAKEQVTD